MIEVKNINKKYQVEIIKDFSYIFPNKGLITILGSSGSGKSTLLNIISGIDNDFCGEVIIDGSNLKAFNKKDKSLFRLYNIGYVFQDFKLLNLLSVNDNVLFNLDAISDLSRDGKKDLVNKALTFVGLKDKNTAIINKLSGGERQRVAIARAIINEPKYLLCDEPTGNLDDNNALNIFSLLKEYSKNHLVIVVTHDIKLANQFSDEIINLNDGKIASIDKINAIGNTALTRLDVNKKKHVALSLGLRLKTGLSKIKEKKLRSAFTNLITSFSLLALGIGIIISTTLKSEIVSSFRNVINSNEILVNKKSNNPNPYTSYIATDEFTVREIKDNYRDYCYDMGVTYLNNFNAFFKDKNKVYFSYLDQYKVEMPTFHSSLFVNYIWKEETNINKFYPRYEREDLELDEVILGLTYVDMVNLCLSLKIERNFEALGAFIDSKDVMINLDVENDDWEYQDNQYLKLVAVYNSSKSEVYHTNHYFNQNLFEEKMRFPTTNEIASKPYVPYTLKKVFTIHTIESPTSMIEEVMYDKKYDDILLERSENFTYDSCIVEEACFRNILFVFTLDKNAVDISDIAYFKKVVPDIDTYYSSSLSGYQMHSSGLLAGFSNPIAFSFSEEKAFEVGDYFSKKIEGKMIDFPNTAVGDITRSNNNGVLFSSDLNNIAEGEVPNNYDEIVISKGLVDYLGYKENPLLQDLYYSSYIETLNTVALNKFKVVGIVNSDKNYIYHHPLFTTSFFRDKLGISSFNLVPSNMVLTLNQNANTALVLDKLNNSFKQYSFTCPIDEISKTVDGVMNYVKSVATVFVILTLLVTTLLLSLISYLNALESKNEIKTLIYMGHTDESIMGYMLSHAFVTSIITTSLSIIELLIFQIIIPRLMSSILGINMGISFSFLPLILTILVGMSLPILISFIITCISFKKITN